MTAAEIARALSCGRSGCSCGREIKPGEYLTHCPRPESHAHGDRTPSFTVKESGGKILIKCFGDCSQEALIEALKAKGLWPSRNGDRPRAATGGGLTLAAFAAAKKLDPAFLARQGVTQATGADGSYIVFHHKDLDGKPLPSADRYRKSLKARPYGKSKAKGGKPALYGLWRLADFRPGGEIILVEGESDTMTSWFYGLPAVGLPGKGLLKTIDPAHFKGFETVYAWQEPDAPELPGKVAARLPGVTVRALLPPPGLKDISQAHCQGVNVPELVDRLKAEAQEVNLEDDYEALEREAIQNEPALIKPQGLKNQLLSLKQFQNLNIPERRMFLEPWIQEFSLVMIYGPRGAGKTNFALGLVNALASGQAFGPWKAVNPASCLYLDGELPAQDLKKRLSMLSEAMDTDNVYVLSSSLVSMSGLPSINLNDESTRKDLQTILLEQKFNVFLIDNLSSLAGGIDENVKKEWDPINQWLLDLRFSGITTIFFHHDNKAGGQRGTRGREDQVDFVLNVGLPKDYEATDGCRFIARFEKQRTTNEYLPLLADTEFKLETDEGGAPIWTFKNVKADNRRRILQMIDEGIPQVEICKLLDLSKGYVSDVKRRAITAGDLTENGKFTQAGFSKYGL